MNRHGFSKVPLNLLKAPSPGRFHARDHRRGRRLERGPIDFGKAL